VTYKPREETQYYPKCPWMRVIRGMWRCPT